ncbi:MAG TPA: hypothetical protein PLU80_15105, partial [Acidobacteriota bacterium]|nr:hypothetical protein [Acidobacteriota bacterium]
QLDKELYSQRPEEETNLEHLEGRLRRAGQKPVTVTQKSQGWERLQHHLVELAKTLPGGDRNPHYQEERDFINEFRAEHGWRPPEGWTAPTTTLVPAAVPTGPLAAPPPPSTTAVGDDTEAYRKRMRLMIGKKRGASLTSDDIARMIRIAQEDYRLDPQTARQIIEAEQNGGGNQPNTQNLEKYREVCREVMEGGIVSDEGREILADSRQRYGLTSDQAAAIEAAVLAQEKYRDVCHEVIEDGVIPAEGRSVLDDARIRLQLSPEDAVNIESQVLFGQ